MFPSSRNRPGAQPRVPMPSARAIPTQELPHIDENGVQEELVRVTVELMIEREA
jgi:hypothetical protein